MNCKCCCVKFVALYWRVLFTIFVPLMLLPVFLLNNTKEYKYMYVVLIMITFWVTEALPLPVTSLIPIGLFPLLGVSSTADVCKMYAHEIVIMFLGSLIIALSIELCNLHKRIALLVMCCVACGHRRLHFGLMMVSMLLSMWMQNIIVVAMISPVCLAILEQLEAQGIITLFRPRTDKDSDEEIKVNSDEEVQMLPDEKPRPTRITICYFLGITYAASLGGCGSLLGTATNLTVKGIYETTFPACPEIDFSKFIEYAAPVMLLNTLLTWLWMQVFYMGMFRPKSKDATAIYVSKESAKATKKAVNVCYSEMGKLTCAELQVAILLVLVVLVWVFRSPDFVKGWGPALLNITTTDATPTTNTDTPTIKDATPTIVFIIFLFMLPSKWSCFNFCKRNKADIPDKSSQSLLTWAFVRQRIPWGLVFLVGAGLAIADCGHKSGMSTLIGQHLIFLKKIPPLAILFLVCLTCQILTEFSSNVAVANIIIPGLAELSKAIEIHPMYLMLPAALSTSMAFHLPVGTPGNAFVAGLINIPKKDMILCGIGPTIITLLTYWGSFHTYGPIIFQGITDVSPCVNVTTNVTTHCISK